MKRSAFSIAFPSRAPMQQRLLGRGVRPAVEISDLRRETMTDGDARELLSMYVVIRHEKWISPNGFDDDGNPVRPTWERISRFEDPNISQQEAIHKVRELTKGGSVAFKKGQLGVNIQRQLEETKRALKEEDPDTRYRVRSLSTKYNHGNLINLISLCNQHIQTQRSRRHQHSTKLSSFNSLSRFTSTLNLRRHSSQGSINVSKLTSLHSQHSLINFISPFNLCSQRMKTWRSRCRQHSTNLDNLNNLSSLSSQDNLISLNSLCNQCIQTCQSRCLQHSTSLSSLSKIRILNSLCSQRVQTWLSRCLQCSTALGNFSNLLIRLRSHSCQDNLISLHGLCNQRMQTWRSRCIQHRTNPSFLNKLSSLISPGSQHIQTLRRQCSQHSPEPSNNVSIRSQRKQKGCSRCIRYRLKYTMLIMLRSQRSQTRCGRCRINLDNLVRLRSWHSPRLGNRCSQRSTKLVKPVCLCGPNRQYGQRQYSRCRRCSMNLVNQFTNRTFNLSSPRNQDSRCWISLCTLDSLRSRYSPRHGGRRSRRSTKFSNLVGLRNQNRPCNQKQQNGCRQRSMNLGSYIINFTYNLTSQRSQGGQGSQKY
ncbi:hypothetical protein RJ55_04136 [Drechmeria coniospora]|nr:hypothetical protein RJ55_04136 [Drechmeria coniospora]